MLRPRTYLAVLALIAFGALVWLPSRQPGSPGQAPQSLDGLEPRHIGFEKVDSQPLCQEPPGPTSRDQIFVEFIPGVSSTVRQQVLLHVGGVLVDEGDSTGIYALARLPADITCAKRDEVIKSLVGLREVREATAVAFGKVD